MCMDREMVAGPNLRLDNVNGTFLVDCNKPESVPCTDAKRGGMGEERKRYIYKKNKKQKGRGDAE